MNQEEIQKLDSIAEETQEYREFVEKFKPKKTTDDCYTPENIYESVLLWVMAEYDIQREDVIRPFWPGADYEHYAYPPGCCVVDNPPFSIITKICRFYQARGIRFFLFAPYLTNFNIASEAKEVCHVITDAGITYLNGVVVNTSFVTNMDEYLIRTAPELKQMIDDADRHNRRKNKKELPKYSYPLEILTATMAGRYAKYGVDFRIRPNEAVYTQRLDAQIPAHKAIFGGAIC